MRLSRLTEPAPLPLRVAFFLFLMFLCFARPVSDLVEGFDPERLTLLYFLSAAFIVAGILLFIVVLWKTHVSMKIPGPRVLVVCGAYLLLMLALLVIQSLALPSYDRAIRFGLLALAGLLVLGAWLGGSIPALRKVRAVLRSFRALRAERAAAGGALAPEEERPFIDRLDGPVPALLALRWYAKRADWRTPHKDEAERLIANWTAAAVAELVEGLGNEDGDVRWQAAKRLLFLGPDAAAAETALERALDDEHEGVRRAAASALERIRGSG